MGVYYDFLLERYVSRKFSSFSCSTVIQLPFLSLFSSHKLCFKTNTTLEVKTNISKHMRHPTLPTMSSSRSLRPLILLSITTFAYASPLHPRSRSSPFSHQLSKRYYEIDQSTIIPVATIVGVIILAIFFCSCSGFCKVKNRDPALSRAVNAELAFEIHTIGCPKNRNTIGKSRNGGRCTCSDSGHGLGHTGDGSGRPFTMVHSFGCPKRPGLGQVGYHPDATCTCSALGEAYGPRGGAVPPMPPYEILLRSYSHDGQVINPHVDAPPPYSPPVNTTLRGPEPVYSPQREGRANATAWTERGFGRQAPEVQRGRGWSRWAA